MDYPRIESGKRAIVAGRTGSGKSTLACWLLSRSLQHWVILNPKHTAAYRNLPDSEVLSKFETRTVEKSIEKNRFTILNLSGEQATAEYMDSVIQWLHESFSDVGLCADEIYTLHIGGKAGDGLVGYLTRGRELRQSFLGLAQRPKWLSLFCFSESDYIIEMDLTISDDRKRVFEFTGHPASLERMQPHRWVWYDVSRDAIAKYGPVPHIDSAPDGV